MLRHLIKRYFFILLFLAIGSHAFANNPESSRILVHMLNYLGQDYKHAVSQGKIISQDEYNEQLEFCENAEKYFKEFSVDWSDSDSAEVGQMINSLIEEIHHKGDYKE